MHRRSGGKFISVRVLSLQASPTIHDRIGPVGLSFLEPACDSHLIFSVGTGRIDNRQPRPVHTWA